MEEHRTLSMTPGFIIGASVAGFFDGIMLHQILQWHHMICIEEHCVAKTVATMEQQNFYDGLFHAGMLVVLLIGLAVLTNAFSQGLMFSQRRFWGSLLLGAGVFNVVEGIVDHHILQIHHVRFGPGQPAWDIGFLIIGAAMAVGGWLLTRDLPAPPTATTSATSF